MQPARIDDILDVQHVPRAIFDVGRDEFWGYSVTIEVTTFRQLDRRVTEPDSECIESVMVELLRHSGSIESEVE